VRASFHDTAYPADPYPGARPEHSFVHNGRTGWPVAAAPSPSGWTVEPDGTDLDDWLVERGVARLAERVPVLAYGSNCCPSKVTWLREERGLTGPAVVLRARCEGLAAVWSAGFRVVDDQRPATLAAAPGTVEEHAVWLATPEQVRALDRCEGRGRRYRLARLHTGRIVLEDGAVVDGALGYVSCSAQRQPLLVDGAPVRCADLPQADAATLTGTPAPTDGLDCTTVTGEPEPLDWPDRVFVYGTLQPGQPAWRLIEPELAGHPVPATIGGTLYDTGLGYPALRLGEGPGVPGHVLGLASPRRALPALDRYEGEEYRRVRTTLPDGQICWTYLWTEPVHGLTVLRGGWAAAG
jgi:gamma-glutamylcyclotransferase (GGCT)/AIG2-like uncharacterized protein YtfP